MARLNVFSATILFLSLFRSAWAQEDDGRLQSEIPVEEAEQIQVVEEITVTDPEALPAEFAVPSEEVSVLLSPEYPLYSEALPIPPIKEPLRTLTNPINGNPIRYYEIEITQYQEQVFANTGATTLVGYDGMSPGPTFQIPQGTESVVRFINNAPELENSVHLHGSPSRAPFDGWAEDVTNPGQYKDYYFPNYQSARMLWYHDHAMHITTENAYFGQAGAYIISDSREDALGLPGSYGDNDIPMILTSKRYNDDGSLVNPKAPGPEDSPFFGDIIQVNGKPWPYMDVQPKKYRFRFLNAAVSRSFALHFVNSESLEVDLPFQVIASDAGLLERPIDTEVLYVSMAERYEVIFDFTQFAGQSIEIRNLPQAGGIGAEQDFQDTDKVIRFNVSPEQVEDATAVPTALRTVPFPPETSGIDHEFVFAFTNGAMQINGVGFADVENRILANVSRGTVELWKLRNASPFWSHPVHVHLVDFKVINRTSLSATGSGRSIVEPYEDAGLKDVVWLGKEEEVIVEAHYQPWAGVYMFHCHNLLHEDNDMMAAFNVTSLENFGYQETTDFDDPMDPRWRAVDFQQSDLTARSGPFSDDAVSDKVESLAREQPYSELEEVTEALTEYWIENGEGVENSPIQGRRARRFSA